MSLKTSLILLTVISVICDTMILPFYPMFFSERFTMDDASHVGYYIAACCFTVMITFPIWAKVAKRVHETHLWVMTQLVSMVLGIACYFATNLVEFWVYSQLMLVFKASYLLIYPFVMRLEEKDKHLGMVGLFSVLMHFGGIGGALIGGYILEHFTTNDFFLIMAAGDAIQVIICLYLIKQYRFPFHPDDSEVVTVSHTSGFQPMRWAYDVFFNTSHTQILRICFISLIFYLSLFLIRPFFTLYWEAISDIDNAIFSGLVFSIPGWMALAGLIYNHYRADHETINRSIMLAFLVSVIGLFLQSTEQVAIVLIGRCIYGVGMFQIAVKLEVLMFQFSRKDSYGHDFSKLHLFQNIGVLIASLAVGHLVENLELIQIFYIALAGYILSGILFYWFTKVDQDAETPARIMTAKQDTMIS
ncbi:MAG: MFS transporter [Pseudobacteriovorax sp.]|nr:MFS transporter [Pseudobacteriovorax sp.]